MNGDRGSGNVAEFPDTGRRGGPNGHGPGGDIGERVAKLEAHMQHLATKAWVLAGVLGGMVLAASLAASLAIAIIKLFP